jgi:hypothetical protein
MPRPFPGHASLDARYDESLDTLSAERMAFEATFRHTEADGTESIYHLSLDGKSPSGPKPSSPVTPSEGLGEGVINPSADRRPRRR